MLVIANPGERCPMENQPRQYITDSVAADVPGTSFYRRLVREGSLLLADEKPRKRAGTAKTISNGDKKNGGNE